MLQSLTLRTTYMYTSGRCRQGRKGPTDLDRFCCHYSLHGETSIIHMYRTTVTPKYFLRDNVLGDGGFKNDKRVYSRTATFCENSCAVPGFGIFEIMRLRRAACRNHFRVIHHSHTTSRTCPATAISAMVSARSRTDTGVGVVAAGATSRRKQNHG